MRELSFNQHIRSGLRIRKLPKRTHLIYWQIYLVSFVFWLRSDLHFPAAVTYITDVITVSLLLTRFNLIRKKTLGKAFRREFFILIGILFGMLIGTFLNFVNPLLVLWGMRNNLRFFAFFLICASLLTEKDIDNIASFLITLFWLNVLMSTVQFFALGISGDYLGGFFGTASGANVYTIVLLNFACAYVIAKYFYHEISLPMLLITVLACFYLALLAELKIIYVIFVLIFAISVLLQKPSLKALFVLLAGTLAVFIALNLLYRYAPGSFHSLFDRAARNYYLSGKGYTNSGDLNRLTAVQEIYTRFFKGSLLHSIFGFGLGSGETSSFRFLQSSFFRRYEFLHYRWFTHAWVYLEQGALGLGLLVAFFISLLISTLQKKERIRKDLWMMSLLFICTCFAGIIYNCALEVECAYIIAFVCAIPFAAGEGRRKIAVL